LDLFARKVNLHSCGRSHTAVHVIDERDVEPPGVALPANGCSVAERGREKDLVKADVLLLSAGGAGEELGRDRS